MASHGSLPLYYKNSKPTGLSGSAKSWKDKYLIVVVFVGFIILIAGTFWFLPPLEDKDGDYEEAYGRFTGNPASYITDPVIPSEPTLEPPETTGKGLEKGGEGGDVGAAKERPNDEEKKREMKAWGEEDSKEPIHLEDLIQEEIHDRGEVESFKKHRLDPPIDKHRPDPPINEHWPDPPVEKHRPDPPIDKHRPDPPVVVASPSEIAQSTEDGAATGNQELVAERRKKVVEVRECEFFTQLCVIPLE